MLFWTPCLPLPTSVNPGLRPAPTGTCLWPAALTTQLCSQQQEVWPALPSLSSPSLHTRCQAPCHTFAWLTPPPSCLSLKVASSRKPSLIPFARCSVAHPVPFTVFVQDGWGGDGKDTHFPGARWSGRWPRLCSKSRCLVVCLPQAQNPLRSSWGPVQTTLRGRSPVPRWGQQDIKASLGPPGAVSFETAGPRPMAASRLLASTELRPRPDRGPLRMCPCLEKGSLQMR